MIRSNSLIICVVPEGGEQSQLIEYVDSSTFFDMHPDIKPATIRTWVKRGKIPNVIKLHRDNLYPINAQLPTLWTDKRTNKTRI